jgi:hypothetical protein
MPNLLVAIVNYHIGAYRCLFYWWLLMVILLMSINVYWYNYFINGY